jgi:hypothetical protein
MRLPDEQRRMGQIWEKVDVLIVRTVPCGQDSRVSKFLFHYRKNQIRVGIVCISRSGRCSRKSETQIPHYSVKGLDFNALPYLLNRIPGVWKLHRFLLYTDYVLTSIKIWFLWRPKVLHGCDLDGYLISKLAFPYKRKRIFEVLDPWTTMTTSKRIAKLEKQAFSKSKVLVMPAFDSRIKVLRDKSTSFSNFMETELAQSLMVEAENDSSFTEYIDSLKPFILTGGIMGHDTKIEELTHAIASQSVFNLVAACDPGFIKGNGFLRLPQNVFCIGKQDWGKWLYLVKSCSAIWIYYSKTNNHFASHISPNKYWEAVLFNKAMLVNEISQFCDRVDFEGHFIEIGDDLETGLKVKIKDLREVEPQPSDLSTRSRRLEEIAVQRTKTVKQILDWVLD